MDVPGAATLGEEPAGGGHDRVEAIEQRLVVVDPVEGRVGEDDVDGLGKLELQQVLTQEGRAVPELLPRMGHHRRGGVDSVHAAARHQFGDQRGDSPRARPGIEHDLIAVQVQPVQLLLSPGQLRSRDAVIGGGVPVP